MWQRWNGTSHVFEKSDDNGSSWAPLPLSALTITEGTLPAARLPASVIRSDLANTFYVGPTSFTDWLQINRTPASPFILFQESGVNKSRIGATLATINFADGVGNTKFTFDIGTQGYLGIGAVGRTSGANATAISIMDNVGGVQSPGYGVQIRGFSNGGGVVSVVGFEAGGSGTNNESQLSFWTQPSAGLLTKQMVLTSNGLLFLTPSGAGGYSMVTWPTTVAAANVQTGDSAPLYRSTSSLRFKTDIETITLESARAVINKLRGITYRGMTDNDNKRRYAGFGAEEVASLDPVLVTYDKDNKPDYVTYDRVPAYLVPVTQDHEARLLALEARLNNGK